MIQGIMESQTFAKQFNIYVINKNKEMAWGASISVWLGPPEQWDTMGAYKHLAQSFQLQEEMQLVSLSDPCVGFPQPGWVFIQAGVS